MEKELIYIIKLFGFDLIEILIDITIDGVQYESIEILEDDNIILHSYQNDTDVETYFYELSLDDQEMIITTLKPFVYN